jgi:hypothetical protein
MIHRDSVLWVPAYYDTLCRPDVQCEQRIHYILSFAYGRYTVCMYQTLHREIRTEESQRRLREQGH